MQIVRSFWNAQDYCQDYYEVPTFSDTPIFFIYELVVLNRRINIYGRLRTSGE